MTNFWFEPHPEAPSLRRASDEGMTALDRLVLARRPQRAVAGGPLGRRRRSGDLEPTAGVDGDTGPSESLGTGT